ncbi:MAG TPA: hypothetical protein DCO77_00275, partial [Nitrospiraceae bacterium]|nr:hypothetical protein [Nitrospiraceae bacterium]
KKRGLDQNTIVVFTADHGEGFNEHELFEHGRSYYEELLHVPLIISGLGVSEGVVVDDPVSLIDLMGTLRGLLDLPAREGSPDDGFLKALTGHRYTSGPMYFDSASNLAGNDCRDALWNESFKLITHLTVAEVELYDLRNDPGERHNLAAVEAELARQMLASLQDFREMCAAQAEAIAGKGSSAAESVSAAEREKVLKKLKSLGYVN